MVKNLADELSDILGWVENPGLGEHAREEANAGLVIFCRGLVCGLRGGQQVTGDMPISLDGELFRKAEHVARREAKLHEILRRERQQNAQLRPVNEDNRVCTADEALGKREPFPSDCRGSEPLRGHC